VPGRRALLLVTVAAAGLAAFAVLAVAVVRETALVDLDERLSRRVAETMPRFAEWLALPPTWIGGLVGLTVVSLLAAAVLLAAGRRGDAVWIVASVALVQLLVAVVKTGFDRARPADGAAIPLPTSSSFPSGHAAAGLVTAGALAVLFGTGRRTVVVWSAAALASLVIGASRVVLNVHYASDVLAGFSLGIACLAIALLVRDAVHRWGTSRGTRKVDSRSSR
jgi:undecaprenyl-diphosphatase